MNYGIKTNSTDKEVHTFYQKEKILGLIVKKTVENRKDFLINYEVLVRCIIIILLL